MIMQSKAFAKSQKIPLACIFLDNTFKYAIYSSESSIFSWYPFPKTMLFSDQYVVSMQMLA